MSEQELRDFIGELADASGRVIRHHFLTANLPTESKADGTVVTPADREAEEAMRDLIRRRYPNHGLIGEEFGRENEQAEFVWTLDPIDGTLSFISGCPLFGTLIGLLHRGEPILGAIHQPVLGQFCLGDNQTTTLNGKPVRMRTVSRLSEATVLATDALAVSPYQPAAGFERLIRRARIFRTWGDCYGYLLLASGWADVMLDPIMNPWDILPLIPIIRGAGGAVTAWNGQPAASATSCVAASKRLHPVVLEMLNG
jgi:histidinol phosphatase-like enzyme (inositol monophosphatase family)